MNLRELDARVIPDLARRTQELADRVRTAHASVAARIGRLRPAEGPAVGPGGPAPAVLRLRALDARYARRGPLALMRDVPQLGVLLIALVVALNAAVFMQRSDRSQQLVATSPGSDRPIVPGLVQDAVVGPEIGDNVVEYVLARDRDLQSRLVADRFERSSAVVSFDSYRTPADVATLLGEEVGAFRVFFRVPLPLDTPVEEHPVKRLVIDTITAYETVAASRLADIPDLVGQAQTTDDPAFKADYEMTARQYAQEAAQLERGCACVFAVAVHSSIAALQELRQKAGVRVVDLAPPKADIVTTVFRGLRPEEKVTVTNGNQKRDADGNVVG